MQHSREVGTSCEKGKGTRERDFFLLISNDQFLMTNFYILITLFIFLSCGSKKQNVPNDIIAEDKIVDVIVEIELTQAIIKLKFLNKDSLVNQTQLFNEVYAKHNISQEQFNNSLAFYAQEPKKMDTLYAKVITKLSEKQAEIQ